MQSTLKRKIRGSHRFREIGRKAGSLRTRRYLTFHEYPLSKGTFALSSTMDTSVRRNRAGVHLPCQPHASRPSSSLGGQNPPSWVDSNEFPGNSEKEAGKRPEDDASPADEKARRWGMSRDSCSLKMFTGTCLGVSPSDLTYLFVILYLLL